MTESSQLLEVAYHEAGHAAIHIYLDLLFDCVSIISVNGAEGWVAHPVLTDPREWGEDPDVIELLIDKHVTALLAGPVAQECLTDNYDSAGAGGDHDTLMDLVSRRCRSDDEATAYLAWMHIRTRNMVNMCWPQIEAIAAALVEAKELSYDDVLEMVRRPVKS